MGKARVVEVRVTTKTQLRQEFEAWRAGAILDWKATCARDLGLSDGKQNPEIPIGRRDSGRMAIPEQLWLILYQSITA